jgi:YHS domain-containing protein
MVKGKEPFHIYIDPVCLMRLDPQAQHPTLTYRTRTYHFCAESCRRTFEEKPERYLDDSPPPHKSLWRRYLERLNKATGGKPPSCCR